MRAGGVSVNMFLAHTWHFNVFLVLRLLEQWMMTCRTARLVQTVVSSRLLLVTFQQHRIAFILVC